MLRTAASILLAALPFTSRAQVVEEKKEEQRIPVPNLRIEAGMHTAQIASIATDASGKLVLTVSEDKTARLWDTSGRLLRVLLPFSDPGMGIEGRLYAGALHPSGSLAAVGGWTRGTMEPGKGAHSVYLFETSSGKVVRRLGGVPNLLADLSFSKGGKYLAAVCATGGLFVWDVSTGNLVGSDENYGGPSKGVDWHGNERIATSCYDNQVRLYTLQGGRLTLDKKMEAMIWQGHAIRFTPTGSHVAIGSDLISVSEIINVTNPDLGYTLEVPETEFGTLPSVAWSSDGQYFAAGGLWGDANENMRLVRLWKVSSKAKTVVRDVPVSKHAILDLRALPGGGFLFASVDPSWGIIADPKAGASKGRGSAGKYIEQRGDSPIMDFRGTSESLRISPDGSVVSIQPHRSKEPMVFSIPSRRLSTDPQAASKTWLQPRTDSLPITDWKDNREPKLNGVVLKSSKLGASRALAISSDRAFFVLGQDVCYTGHTADGEVNWIVHTSGGCWAVNFSADNKVLVAAAGDGTITWRSMTSGRNLLTLYVYPGSKQWIVWTPEGYYDCSPGAEDLLSLRINHGSDQAGDAFPISRFRKLLYRPDIIQEVLKTGDVRDAHRLANEALGRAQEDPAKITGLLAALYPPVVELETGGVFREVVLAPGAKSVDLTYGVRQTGPEAPTGVEVRLNGRPSNVAAPVPPKDGKATLTLPLPPAFEGEVSVIASHALGQSSAATLRVRRSAAPSGKKPLPNLFVLSAGVAELAMNTTPTLAASNASGQSKGQFQNLEFAADDAQSVASLLASQKGRAFAQVETTVLLNQQATTTAVRDAIKTIREKAQPGDVMLFFFSGHGNHDPKTGKFHLVTYDTDPHRESETAFSGEEMSQLLGQVRASVVVALDACHSGSVLGMQQGEKYKAPSLDISGLANQLSSAEHGIVVLSSSTPDQFSFEDREAGGGLFTKALLEGLKGKAAKNGAITCGTLMQWIDKRVPELISGGGEGPEQTPVTVMPSGVPDFTLARSSPNK